MQLSSIIKKTGKGFFKSERAAFTRIVSAALTRYLQACPGLARNGRAGFTIIEMLVSLTIIGLISSVVIYEYSKFDSQLILRNMAYEIALGIRQAQSLGISVQQGGSGNFLAPYGIHFTLGKNYVLFRDLDGDYLYDSNEVVTTFGITGKNQITSLCSVGSSGTTCGKTALDLVFVRPDPDANIADQSGRLLTASGANVIVASTISGGNSRTISISVTGQISIQ